MQQHVTTPHPREPSSRPFGMLPGRSGIRLCSCAGIDATGAEGGHRKRSTYAMVFAAAALSVALLASSRASASTAKEPRQVSASSRGTKAASGPTAAPNKKSYENVAPAPINLASAARFLTQVAGNPPSQFELWSSKRLTRNGFFERAAASFLLTATDAMVEGKTVALIYGREVTRFQMTSHGIPVVGASYWLTQRDGWVTSGRGRIVPGLDISPTPAVSEATALAVAKAATQGSSFQWEVDQSPPPAGHLVAFSADFGASQPYRLAWTFVVTVVQPSSGWRVFIDAQNGAVLGRFGTRQELAAKTPQSSAPTEPVPVGPKLQPRERLATGTDFRGRPVQFLTQSCGAQFCLLETDHRTIHTTRPDGEFLDDDNKWTESGLALGVSAHWAAEQFWDFVTSRMPGFSSPLNDNGLHLVIDDGGCPSGPEFEADRQWVHLCGGGSPDAQVGIGVVGHELTHNLMSVLDPPALTLPTEALWEAVADMIGDSLMASETSNPGPVSGVDRANIDVLDHLGALDLGLSDTVGDAAFKQASATVPTDASNADPAKLNAAAHQLAGPFERWFYLLANGGTGKNALETLYAVKGVGRLKAEMIVLNSLPFFGVDTGYQQFADITEETAANLFSTDSVEHNALCDAWAAVGLAPSACPRSMRIPLMPGTKLPVAGHTNVSPAADAEHIPAWPAVLRFQVPLWGNDDHATRWQVQVSSDPTFASDVHTAVISSLSAPGQALTTMVLRAGTVYSWRARTASGGSMDAFWAFTLKFQTSFEQPRKVHPGCKGEPPPANPWPMRFSWDPVDGATAYQLQLGEQIAGTWSNETGYFSSPIFPVSTTDTSVDRFLPIGQYYSWRVRAVGPPGGGSGDWAIERDIFDYPCDPRAILVPSDVAGQDAPWSPSAGDFLQFKTARPVPNEIDLGPWMHPVDPWGITFRWQDIHAKGYDIVIDTAFPLVATPIPATPITLDPQLGLVYFKRDLHPSTTYRWKVRGKGYFGDDSDWTSVFAFDTTSAKPSLWTPVGSGNAAWPTSFTWAPVGGASGYEIKYPDAPDSWTAISPKLNTPVGLANPTSAEWRAFLFPDSSRTYEWRLRAKGPNGDIGEEAVLTFSVKDYRPSLISPASNAELPGGKVEFRVDASDPNTASYTLNVFDDASGNLLANHSGIVATNWDWTPNVLFAAGKKFRVELTGLSQPGWSPGQQVNSLPRVSYFQTKPARPCDSSIHQGGDAPESFDIELGKTSGQTVIRYNTYNIPDQLVFTYPDGKVYSTGCVSTYNSERQISVKYDGANSSTVHVDVTPNCNGATATQWDFVITCP